MSRSLRLSKEMPRDGLVNVLFYVEAGENANVNVSKVQIHGSHVRHIDQRYTHDGKGSKVKFVSAEVGGQGNLGLCPHGS